MANSHTHAVSSARRFGGQPSDYQAVHDWFDATKATYADVRHRALRHHTFGIFESEERFGHALQVHHEDGTPLKLVPTRLIAEQHVVEDCGFIPTVQEWLEQMPVKPFMLRGAIPLSRILANLEAAERHEVELSDEARAFRDRLDNAVVREVVDG